MLARQVYWLMRHVCFRSRNWANLRGLALGATAGVVSAMMQGICGLSVRVTGQVQLARLQEVGTEAVGAATPSLG